MFAQIVAIFQALKAILDFVKYFQNWKVQQDKIEAERRQQELEKHVDKVVDAEGDDAIFEEQLGVINNKPRG